MDDPATPSAAKPASPMLPRTLLGRMVLLVAVGMAVAQLFTFAAIRYERGQVMQSLMIGGIERDIASSIAVLDRLPAAERAEWLDRLERPNYRFALSGQVDTPPPATQPLRSFADTIAAALRPYPVLAMGQVSGMGEAVRLRVGLSDGSSLYLLARRVPMPVADWVLWLLAAQWAVLALCAWQAARLLTRPLRRLGEAADALGPDLRPTVLDERGPVEVASAARAFNAMQRRIAGYVQERVQILAAVSHDLQTPITRMRLRIDLMDHLPERDRFRQDLDAMRTLVQEGVGYARTLQGPSEAERRVDVRALLDSLVNDYADIGEPVTLDGDAGAPLATRPQALRRVLGNLVDNALKYGGCARVHAVRHGAGDGTDGRAWLCIDVRDDGPGIPPDQLEAVLRPFHRVEGSRSRDTGGTGLGLAIAHQLVLSMGGTLALRNRDEGGLEARVRLPA